MKKRIRLGFMLLAGLLFLTGIISYFELARLNNSTQKVVDFGAKSVALSNEMLGAIASLDNVIVKHVNGTDTASFIRQAGELSEKMDKLTTEIKNDYPQNTALNNLIFANNGYLKTVTSPDSVAKNTDWYLSTYKSKYAALENGVKNFMTSTQNTVVNEVNKLKNNAYRTIMYGIVATGTSIAVILLFYFFISVYYIRPVVEISKALKNYLSMRVPFDVDVASKDEVFMLKEYIEQLILRIRSKKNQ